MAVVTCTNPCFVACLPGSNNCSQCGAGTDKNCAYIPQLQKSIDITKLECSECAQYMDTEIGKNSCMSVCQKPAGFDEEQLDELGQQTQKRNKLIIVIAVLLIVLIIVGTLIYSI